MSIAAPRSRKMGLAVAVESTFATDPSTDGSGYTRVPAEGMSGSESTEILETEYLTDRNYPTETEVGAGGASLTFSTPLIGMASAAGDGTNASTVTDDWLDILLEHTFGAQATTAGSAITTVSSATGIVSTTDVLNVQDIAPIYEAGVPTIARSQWNAVTADSAGTYTLAPGFQDYGTAPPTTSAILYGSKIYTDTDAGGSTLAAVCVDDTKVYVKTGGRVNRLRISASQKRRVMLEWGMAFDASSGDEGANGTNAKTAIPAAARMATTPIKHLLSPVFFNGSRIACKSVDVDFGISAAEVEDSNGTNGRSGNELVSVAPTITIDPLHAESYRQLKRAGTKGRVLAQFGGGVLSGGVLNTCAVAFELADVREVEDQDDAGRKRQRIRFHAVDSIEFSAGVGARFMSFARA